MAALMHRLLLSHLNVVGPWQRILFGFFDGDTQGSSLHFINVLARLPRRLFGSGAGGGERSSRSSYGAGRGSSSSPAMSCNLEQVCIQKRVNLVLKCGGARVGIFTITRSFIVAVTFP